jgi:hypothetical protein
MTGTYGDDAAIYLGGGDNAAKHESVGGGSGCVPLAPVGSRLVAYTPL